MLRTFVLGAYSGKLYAQIQFELFRSVAILFFLRTSCCCCWRSPFLELFYMLLRNRIKTSRMKCSTSEFVIYSECVHSMFEFFQIRDEMSRDFRSLLSCGIQTKRKHRLGKLHRRDNRIVYEEIRITSELVGWMSFFWNIRTSIFVRKIKK